MASLGEVLKALRERAGITQAELATRAGIDRTTLARLETNVYDASWATIQKLAAALGVSTEKLRSDVPDAPAPRRAKKKGA